jgi:hypothetical protein
MKWSTGTTMYDAYDDKQTKVGNSEETRKSGREAKQAAIETTRDIENKNNNRKEDDTRHQIQHSA